MILKVMVPAYQVVPDKCLLVVLFMFSFNFCHRLILVSLLLLNSLFHFHHSQHESKLIQQTSILIP